MAKPEPPTIDVVVVHRETRSEVVLRGDVASIEMTPEDAVRLAELLVLAARAAMPLEQQGGVGARLH